jgi:hypothetical protein
MQVTLISVTRTLQEGPMRRAAGRGVAPSTSMASQQSCTRASGAALGGVSGNQHANWLLNAATKSLRRAGTIMQHQPRNPVPHSFRRLGAGPRQQQPQEDAISQPVIEVQCAATADVGALSMPGSLVAAADDSLHIRREDDMSCPYTNVRH